MMNLWDFYRRNGVMTASSYPYVSGSNGGNETTCQYDSSQVTYPV